MISLDRLLLLNPAEKGSPLRGRSNASQLPSLFWGNNVKFYFILFYVFLALWFLPICWIAGGWLKYTKIGDCSTCLNPWTMSLFCYVDTQSTKAASTKWGNISSKYHRALVVTFLVHFYSAQFVLTFVFDTVTGMHALCAQSQFVICQRFGRKLTWRLLLHQCLHNILIKWSVLFLLASLMMMSILLRVNYQLLYKEKYILIGTSITFQVFLFFSY